MSVAFKIKPLQCMKCDEKCLIFEKQEYIKDYLVLRQTYPNIPKTAFKPSQLTAICCACMNNNIKPSEQPRNDNWFKSD